MYISNSFNKTDDENIVAKTISQMVAHNSEWRWNAPVILLYQLMCLRF
jgi:hypothetical protein